MYIFLNKGLQLTRFARSNNCKPLFMDFFLIVEPKKSNWHLKLTKSIMTSCVIYIMRLFIGNKIVTITLYFLILLFTFSILEPCATNQDRLYVSVNKQNSRKEHLLIYTDLKFNKLEIIISPQTCA